MLDIDKLYNTKSFIGKSLESEFTQTIRSEYQIEYFSSVKTSFQFYGYFDEKGLFLDKNVTLENALKFYLNLDNNIDYGHDGGLTKEVPTMMSYLKVRYFHFKFYGQELDDSYDKDKEHLKQKFESFKNDKHELVNYLTDKSYNEKEIDVILNLLSNNMYSGLDIRWIDLKQIELFRCLWLFGIFEYFTDIKGHHFETGSSFEVLLKLNPNNNYNPKSYHPQFKKYYDKIENKSNRDYPFNKNHTEKLMSDIEEKLGIDRGKLNPIP